MALHALEDQVEELLRAHPGLTAPEVLAANHWPGYRNAGLPTEVALGPALTPLVNHGRWVVICPECMSACRASRHDPRFLCCECGNAHADGKWLPVLWPDDADAIEKALSVRPDRRLRNWKPGETVAELLAENRGMLR